MLQKLRCSQFLAQVLLGHAYDMAIDMWSLGCMAAELFLGLPLFPGASEHDLLVRIVDMLGMPPDHVLQKAQHTNRWSSPIFSTCSTPLCTGIGGCLARHGSQQQSCYVKKRAELSS